MTIHFLNLVELWISQILDYLKRLTHKRKSNMANPSLESLRLAVEKTTAVEQSAITLINGVAARIQAAVDAALANGATEAELAPVQAEADALSVQADALAAAVNANT
jgi:C4-type Zn-finger protein